MLHRILRYILSAALFFAASAAAPAQNAGAVPSPRALENAVLIGVDLFNNGEYRQSADFFRSLLRKAPDNDAAWFYLGMSSIYVQDNETAELALGKAAALDPSNYWYRYRLGQFYAATDRPELTGEIYESLLRDFPKKSELYYSLVDIYISQGDYEKALGMLDSLEAVSGKSDPTVVTRYQLLLQLRRPEEAHDCLLAYSREYPSPQVLSMLGDYEMSLYRDSSALAFYDEALSLDGDCAQALLGKAETYRMTARFSEYFPAITEFMSRETVSPRGKAEYLKALTSRLDGKFFRVYGKELDTMYDAALSTHRRDSSVNVAVGLYYLATERTAMADSCFRRNALNFPDDFDTRGNYCSFLFFCKRWEDLKEEAERCIEQFPDRLDFYDYKSGACYWLRDWEGLQATYDSVIAHKAATDEDRVSAYTGKGDAYHAAGEDGKAFKCYEKALAIDPDYLPALNNYAYFLSVEGRKLRKALAMSARTVAAEPDNPTYLDTYGWILHLQGRDSEAKSHFKHAMLYGAKESVVSMDHYAEVLYSLGEYDLAFMYWDQILQKDWKQDIPDLEERVARRREANGR